MILASGKETQFYKISANDKQHIKTITEELPNAHKCGGQSQNRYQRQTEAKRVLYVQKLAELANAYYTKNGLASVTGLIVAGPAEIKNNLSETVLVSTHFHGSNLKLLETAEITDSLVYDVIEKCKDVIDPINDPVEKKVVDEINNLIAQGDTIDKVIFGKNEIMLALENYEIKTQGCC